MKNNYIAWKLKLIKFGNGEGAIILPNIKKHFGYLKYGDAIGAILKYLLQGLLLNRIISTEY